MKTSEDLLESVKTSVTIPANQVLLTNPRILMFANEEIDSKVVPLISSLNQDYFVEIEEEAAVSGESEYSIPYRSIGRTLRDLKISDSSGSVRDVTKMALEDAHLNKWESLPLSFYFRSDKIVIIPTPNSNDLTLQKFYIRKPSDLVEMSSAGKVTAVSTNTLTLDNVPTSFAANTVDIIQGRQGHSLRMMDTAVTSVSGSQVTVASATGAAIGDYVALSGKSPVIQLPDEAFPYLSFLVCKRVLDAIGDFDGASQLDKEILVRKKNLEMLLAPRIEGEQTKIVNRYGLLRGSRGRYLRGVW